MIDGLIIIKTCSRIILIWRPDVAFLVLSVHSESRKILGRRGGGEWMRSGALRAGSRRFIRCFSWIPATLRTVFRDIILARTHTQRPEGREAMMSSLGAESTRPIPCLLCSPPSIPTHVSSSSQPPNRGLERALEEAASSGVLNLSSRKLKEFPQTAANHDLSDTVEAGRGSGERGKSPPHAGLWCRCSDRNCRGSDWSRDFSWSLTRPVCPSTQFC